MDVHCTVAVLTKVLFRCRISSTRLSGSWAIRQELMEQHTFAMADDEKWHTGRE
jgi:stalled ribosome alternative rescue factor ArfA